MCNKDDFNYIKKIIEFLSFDSSTQQKMFPKGILWNIASDVANEWVYEYYERPIKNLLDNRVITIDIAQKFKTICDNFADVSLNGIKFDPSIWTLEGFSNHTFWNQQRKLAKQLLEEISH